MPKKQDSDDAKKDQDGVTKSKDPKHSNQETGQPEDYEEFDVMQEQAAAAEAEMSVESVSGLTENEDEFRSVMQAKDELEQPYSLPSQIAFLRKTGCGKYPRWHRIVPKYVTGVRPPLA